MSPNEWVAMGGELCGNCGKCRKSEWSLANYLGREQTNAAFQKHWQTWLTQEDVDGIVAAGLNTVRIPMGFWIIEDIVDKTHEPYAEGGLDELIRGLEMFKNAGLSVVLDHHALPGVSALNQMFAGNCTDQVEFYNSPNDYNYKRAVTWSIVMAYLSHAHPAFETVFSIAAINEPLQDALETPGLGRFEKAFVLGVRALEFTLGIICDNTHASGVLTDDIALPAFVSALPIIAKLSKQYNISPTNSFDWNNILGSGVPSIGSLRKFLGEGRQRQCLSTQFMNRDWQWNNPSNPADYALGPQIYDNHLYFNFGGVAPEATEESYMQTICNITRAADAAAIGDTPFVTGEWSFATAFNTTNDFLKKWGDAQKRAADQGAGWLFWNWKVTPEAQTWPIDGAALQWSYRDALKAGLLTANPGEYFDKNVCAPYLNSSKTN
jgi:hypothetical protein